MSKPFEYKDFNKRYKNLSTNNFPTLKGDKLQDNIKFKFSSSAQKGVKLDSSVNTINSSTTESEFGVKLNLDDLKGTELGFSAKSKPSLEFSAKVNDQVLPIEGSSFTLKANVANPSEQTVSGTFAFANKLVNLNLGATVPVSKRFCSILKEDQEALDKQRFKVDLDFVAKPSEEHDIFVGGSAKTQLPKGETMPLLYTSGLQVGLNNKTTNGGVFVDHKKDEKKVDDKKEVFHETTVGAWVYTEVDDLSGGARVAYTPSKKENSSKGFEFELAAGLQRDSDSKLSSKVVVVPQTILSLGYEQKLSKSTKLTFGYAFLLQKSSENVSNYHFGVEISH